jgi:putative ABC transport system permease protein
MAVDLAWKNLVHDKTRFAITVAGVAFAVMLVISQVGLFNGLLSNATVMIDHSDAELWITARNTPNVDFSNTFPEGYVDRVRSVPGVQRADDLIVWFGQIALPNGVKESLEFYALEDFSRWNLPWKMLEGNARDLGRGYYMVLDDSATKRFGAFKVGDYREVNDVRWKIVGRSADALSFTTTPVAFVDYLLAQRLNRETLWGRTNYILVKLAPGADQQKVAAEIRTRLPYNDVHERSEWAVKSRNYWIQSTGLGMNMGVSVVLGCLVGIVVVAQTLYTSTMEHLKEFGTVKAIGGSNSDIYLLIGEQALISAVLGYALGLALAFATGPLMQKIGLHMIVDGRFLGVVFVGTVLLCLSSAVISFRTIANLDPAMVFRT